MGASRGTSTLGSSAYGSPPPPNTGTEIWQDPSTATGEPKETGVIQVPPTPTVPYEPPPPVETLPPVYGPSDPPGTPPAPPLYGEDNEQPPTDGTYAGGETVEDLYPGGSEDEYGDVVGADPGTVADPTGAGVTETDDSVTNIDTVEAGGSTDRVSGLLDAGAGGINAEETGLTDEARVDAELARILGEDSPLLAQARAQAAQYANSRGLQNTSMAAGMATDAMTKAAMPMAQQNAQQALERELANTENRQEASMFTADQQNQLAALEAQLGQELNVFNAEQLNAASSLVAQMQTALEQQDAAAYNDAAMQLADLQRDAEAQQAELDFAASAQETEAINARNTQIIDSITRLNQQHLQNMGNADIAVIQGTYQQLISTNQAAGSIFNSVITSMGALMDNPDMTPAQVASGLASMQQMLEASLSMMADINDMDFGENVAATIPGGVIDTTRGADQFTGGGGSGSGEGSQGEPEDEEGYR